jgi:NhaP-type Na+/H+ or K+/H+ antiporter
VHRSVTKIALTAVFLAFGTVLPVHEWWPELGSAGLLFSLWALVLRRLPVGLPTLRATGTGLVTSAFIGWSGPIGVASIYYLAFAHRYGLPEYERLFVAGSLAISVSVFGQAAAAIFAVNAYRRATGEGVEEGDELELPGPLP